MIEEQKSEWTVNTLKELVDQRFEDNQNAVDTALLAQEKAVSIAFVSQEKAVNTALLAAKEAVIKAEILTDKRFDTVSNSISQVANQTTLLLPRAEYMANHSALNDKIMGVTDTLNRSSGDKNLYATTSYVTQIVSNSIDALEVKIVTILTPLVDYVAAQKGIVAGTALTKGGLYSAIILTATILGAIFLIVNNLFK